MKRAEILAIGSELLTASRLDTNSLFLTEQLNGLGIDVIEKHVLPDDADRLAAAIEEAFNRVEFVFLSGGLGPTEDDVTREAAARALGCQLLYSEHQEKILVARFERLLRKMAENNRRQAYILDGAEVLPNPHGTAPGQIFRTGNGALFLLPGPPREFKPMVLSEVVPRLRSMLPSQILRTRTFRIAGMGESDLDSLIAPIYTKYKNPTTTVLAGAGDLTVVLFARSETEEEADALLKEVGDPIAALLRERVYAETDDPLEVIVGNILRNRGETVSTAESCTGGLVATRLTEYSGASDFFNGAFVTYTNDQKERLLDVPHEMLEQFTAVSEPVAKAMAEGTRTRTGSTYGVSVTGYAGPSGGTEENPVGTVYIGIATPHKAHAFRFRFGADRTRVRLLSAQTALDLLRRAVLGLELVAWRK